jgi:hypothetical protein
MMWGKCKLWLQDQVMLNLPSLGAANDIWQMLMMMSVGDANANANETKPTPMEQLLKV